MSNLTSNLSHIVIALAVIGAVAALAALGTISGADALAVIAGAAGMSLGGGVASSAASSPVPSQTTVNVPVPSASMSNGVTILPTTTSQIAPGQPTSPT